MSFDKMETVKLLQAERGVVSDTGEGRNHCILPLRPRANTETVTKGGQTAVHRGWQTTG